MANNKTTRKRNVKPSTPDSKGLVVNSSKTLVASQKGVGTASDFVAMMNGVIQDLASGRVTPQVGNSMCNAAGKILKVVEMQHKYGKKVLSLVA